MLAITLSRVEFFRKNCAPVVNFFKLQIPVVGNDRELTITAKVYYKQYFCLKDALLALILYTQIRYAIILASSITNELIVPK